MTAPYALRHITAIFQSALCQKSRITCENTDILLPLHHIEVECGDDVGGGDPPLLGPDLHLRLYDRH